MAQQAHIGLKTLDTKNGSLNLLPKTKSLAKKKILMMAPYGDIGERSPGLLVGTNFKGLLIYRNGTITPWRTDADDYLRKNKISHGIRLSTGDFAVATLYGVF